MKDIGQKPQGGSARINEEQRKAFRNWSEALEGVGQEDREAEAAAWIDAAMAILEQFDKSNKCKH